MNTSATDTPSRPAASALSVVLPELGLLRTAGRRNRRLLFGILGATAVFSVALAVAIFALLGHDAKSARHGATSFAAALVRDDPNAAPAGAAPYVAGVRHHFGTVTGATVVATHNHTVNTGDEADTRNYFVADLLLTTHRGPAVLELAFDNHSLSSDAVSGIRELAPGDVSGLSRAQRAQLEHAFAARGGRAADAITLSSAPASVPASVVTPAPAVSHGVAPAVAQADPAFATQAAQLRCVQRAHGDVTKLQACG
jgi:hypothetical protein